MNPNRIRQLFLLLLGLTYIGMGCFIYLADVIPSPPWGLVLGVMFVAYGSWRSYRAIRMNG